MKFGSRREETVVERGMPLATALDDLSWLTVRQRGEYEKVMLWSVRIKFLLPRYLAREKGTRYLGNLCQEVGRRFDRKAEVTAVVRRLL